MTKATATAASAAKNDAAEGQPAIALSKAQQTAVKKMTTVSARIRYLDSQGFTRSQITKLIPNAKGGQLLYQHVRNVLTTEVAKATS